MKKRRNIAIGTVLILGIGLILSLSVWGNQDEEKTERKKHDVEQRYVDELKYEQTVLEDMEEKNIAPSSAEGYLKLAKEQVEKEDYKKAFEIIREGYQTFAAKELNDYYNQVQRLRVEEEVIKNNDGSYSVDVYSKITGYWCGVTSYNANGEPVLWREVDHNCITGQIVEEREFFYEENQYYVLIMDEKSGNQIQRIEYAGIGGNIVSIAESDPQTGMLTKCTMYREDGSTDVYEYGPNGNGNPTKLYQYDNMGTLETIMTNVYDGKGNLIKQTYYLPDGQISHWIEFVYDKAGVHLKTIGYDQNGNVQYEY